MDDWVGKTRARIEKTLKKGELVLDGDYRLFAFNPYDALWDGQKKFLSVHSTINKVAGALLFAFPLTLTFIDMRYSAAVVCMAATAAAIQEGFTVHEKNCR
jgi:hypothetical protein